MRYRKPPAICAMVPEVEHITQPNDIARFIASEKQQIEGRVTALDLRLRMATWDDLETIRQFHARWWPAGHPTLEEPSLLFRILGFGFVPLVEAPDGRVVACNINEGCDDTDRTSYGVRITVDPTAAGHNLGAELARYSALLGMERGSRVRRGSVGLTNYSSAANTLNHVGFVAAAFYEDFPVHGARFDLALPLTPGGVTNNRIDLDKTRIFLDTHEPERDYVLVKCPDASRLAEMYRQTSFRVVAFLKAGIGTPDNTFLALPVQLAEV
jgi:predicted RNA-binding protein